jgi:hypothetical protein
MTPRIPEIVIPEQNLIKQSKVLLASEGSATTRLLIQVAASCTLLTESKYYNDDRYSIATLTLYSVT